jgi:hypothetical protein
VAKEGLLTEGAREAKEAKEGLLTEGARHAFLMGCRRPWFGRLGRWRKRPTPFDREVHTPSPCPYWRWLMGERSHGATRQIFSRSRKRFLDGLSELTSYVAPSLGHRVES